MAPSLHRREYSSTATASGPRRRLHRSIRWRRSWRHLRSHMPTRAREACCYQPSCRWPCTQSLPRAS